MVAYGLGVQAKKIGAIKGIEVMRISIERYRMEYGYPRNREDYVMPPPQYEMTRRLARAGGHMWAYLEEVRQGMSIAEIRRVTDNHKPYWNPYWRGDPAPEITAASDIRGKRTPWWVSAPSVVDIDGQTITVHVDSVMVPVTGGVGYPWPTAPIAAFVDITEWEVDSKGGAEVTISKLVDKDAPSINVHIGYEGALLIDYYSSVEIWQRMELGKLIRNGDFHSLEKEDMR